MRAVVVSLLVTVGLSLVVVLGIGSQAAADDDDQAIIAGLEKVKERGALVLTDGDEICLAGVRAPLTSRTGAWRAAWRTAFEGAAFFHGAGRPALRDRYGCALAVLENGEGVSLQQMLLAAGWASVDPLSGTAALDEIDAMFALEDQARSAGRGAWKDPAVRPKRADDLSAWIGTHQQVEGTVRRVSENGRYVYLNFGDDWKTDFTTRLDRKMIDTAGFDTASLEGRKLRVRGVLVEARGPLIDIAHLKQIEFLP